MKQFLFTLTLLFTLFSFSQNTGSLSGTVLDKDYNNEPLPQANILIKTTEKGATTDFDGLFSISNIEAGSYTLEVSFVGYETQNIPFEIIAGEEKVIEIILAGSTATLDEVVIQTTTKRESETALLLDQKKAVEIKQSIGADELSRKGVSDAAGAVAKISGVSKQEGSSNVYVRGLGDRYLNTTLNGLALPSNNVNKKNIDLNLFSSDVIENVAISKAYSSRFYGDFAAGNVDISSKDYKGKGFFDFTASTGTNTRAADKSFVRSEGTGYFGYYGRYAHNPFAIILSHGVDPVNVSTPINVGYGASAGKSFDFESGARLSLYATASFENDYEYRDGSRVDFASEFNKRFPNVEEFEYSTTTTAMLNTSFRINTNNKFQFNSLFINSSSDEVGYYGTSGNGFNRNSQSLIDDNIGFYQQNIQFNQDLIYVNQLLGNHKYDKLNIDWAFGYNRVNAHEPDRKRFSLDNYQLAIDDDASTNPVFFNNVDYDNQRYFQEIKDEEINSRLNFAYEFSEKTKLNFGFNGRTKTRDFENIRYGYDITDRNTEITNVNNLNAIFNLDNLNLNNDGLYNIKVINRAIDGFSSNIPGLPENTYNGKLDIFAGYANAELKFGDKWLVVPGARIEAFKQRIEYNVINIRPDDPGFREAENTFFLPSLSLKYALNDDQNLRFSASKTVSNPEFKEVAPFIYEGVTQRVGGNPELLENPSFSTIYNIDFKYEWFISRSEIFSVAAFGKQINDPVNLVIANDATGTQRYFRTGDKATILGFELEARKALLLNADEDALLSAGFNATYMHTEQKLKSSEGSLFTSTLDRTDALQGASPLLINADLSYTPKFGDNYKPMANLVFSYFSDRIAALGSGQLGNIVEKGIPTLDFVLKNKIGKDFEINFSAKNLLDPSIERVREKTSFGNVTLSEYKRGIDLGLQLKYKF